MADFFRYLYITFALSAPLALGAIESGPWGKDADLCYQVDSCCEAAPQGPLERAAEYLIVFHQEVISKADGPRSHFYPTSSHYAMEAIHKYGFFRGWGMGCDRLMRENNDRWIYRTTPGRYNCTTKYDPVP